MEKQNVSEVIEVPLVIPKRDEGAGVYPGGLNGGCDSTALLDRAQKMKIHLGRQDYRECVPCDRCGNCLELRRFNKRGEERLLALYCLPMEMETTAGHTCNMGRPQRNGRKKVVYELENAPSQFRLVGAHPSEVPMETVKEQKASAWAEEEGYRGGSEQYKRKIDGRRLMN